MLRVILFYNFELHKKKIILQKEIGIMIKNLMKEKFQFEMQVNQKCNEAFPPLMARHSNSHHLGNLNLELLFDERERAS